MSDRCCPLDTAPYRHADGTADEGEGGWNLVAMASSSGDGRGVHGDDVPRWQAAKAARQAEVASS